MGIQIDGKPVTAKWFMEWFFDLLGAVIVGSLVWGVFAPAEAAKVAELGFPVIVTALAAYGTLKLLRNVKWIDK
ncbi:MAG TPA: hypothetical protein DCL48_15585 [Alphaproteobacteria bacterium]|nr:hypothetical protein [Alphaproteobacteria bacterium]